VEDLIGRDIICWGTHFFCKLPRDPKKVPWHQDASANYLEPPYDSLDLGGVQVRALGLIAPAWCEEFGVPQNDVGVMILHGTLEPQIQVGDLPVELYGVVNGPKHLVVVTGANHFGYIEGLCIDPESMWENAGEVGGLAGEASDVLQQRTARAYLRSFVGHYLPSGQVVPPCQLLQQTGEDCGDPGDPEGGGPCLAGADDPATSCGPALCSFPALESLNVEVSVCSCLP
jgi:hypothetical protein